jgi:hypothetical protein
MFSADDRVVVRWTGTGTHVGEVNGIPPTGKSVRVDAIAIHKVKGRDADSNFHKPRGRTVPVPAAIRSGHGPVATGTVSVPVCPTPYVTRPAYPRAEQQRVDNPVGAHLG